MIQQHKRRQIFLTEDTYIETTKYLLNSYQRLVQKKIEYNGSINDLRRLNYYIAEEAYQLFSLHYTIGKSIQPLRIELENIITKYEEYTIALRKDEDDEDWAPFYFTAIDEYERCMQLIGLCYLLHRRDLLPRIAAMQDKIYHEQTEQLDTLYEDFLSFELTDRYDVDQWFFDNPYRPLIFSKYRDTKQESIQDIQEYLKLWYPAFESAAWHDTHKMDEGLYFGYWAIEAAAYVYLLDLDDSEITHMIYPKDLVKFAREFIPSEKDISNPSTKTLRCEAGQICPKTSEWYSPANNMEKRYFRQGDVMPEIKDNPWGLTIWYLTE
ncbi:PoNe immunity protein domain-containing protein [Acinetobacter sp. YH12045]|uniref:PoNe immunity protein domain-containing protein n=1 Tax=Acinetobacter sp. YH12045 TaxID=2601051 RepID=UPI0015D22AFB|nr:PoNe immunity protein domain-containing protein [Acinetobacter sp. YH12045]